LVHAWSPRVSRARRKGRSEEWRIFLARSYVLLTIKLRIALLFSSGEAAPERTEKEEGEEMGNDVNFYFFYLQGGKE